MNLSAQLKMQTKIFSDKLLSSLLNYKVGKVAQSCQATDSS